MKMQCVEKKEEWWLCKERNNWSEMRFEVQVEVISEMSEFEVRIKIHDHQMLMKHEYNNE